MKLKEMKMFKKKKDSQVKLGKKHTSKISVDIVYNKGSLVPNELNIHKDCSMVDLIITTMRLIEVMCEEARNQGKDVTTFLVNCAKTYIEAMKDAE